MDTQHCVRVGPDGPRVHVTAQRSECIGCVACGQRVALGALRTSADNAEAEEGAVKSALATLAFLVGLALGLALFNYI